MENRLWESVIADGMDDLTMFLPVVWRNAKLRGHFLIAACSRQSANWPHPLMHQLATAVHAVGRPLDCKQSRVYATGPGREYGTLPFSNNGG